MDDYSSFGILSGSCTGFSPEQFNNKFSGISRKLFVLNFNIRSCNSNLDLFLEFLDSLACLPELIILTETWKPAEIDAFHGFHCNRPDDKRGGGLSIYVRKQLKAKATKISLKSLPELEYLHVKLTFDNNSLKPLDIVGIYHPPNPTLFPSFIESIDILLDSLDNNTNQILAGDFNICGLANNAFSVQLFDLMRSYSFMPHISHVTRHNPHGLSTAIDHIWSNFGTSFESGVFDGIKISDHFINFTFLPINYEKTKVKTRFRNHSVQCIERLLDYLTNFKLFFPLLTANLNFDEKFNLFFDEIDRLYKQCCPIKIKEILIRDVRKPWISREIRQMIQTKHSLFRSYDNGYIPYSEFQSYDKNLQKNNSFC